jgi:hypothetical protein
MGQKAVPGDFFPPVDKIEEIIDRAVICTEP